MSARNDYAARVCEASNALIISTGRFISQSRSFTSAALRANFLRHVIQR